MSVLGFQRSAQILPNIHHGFHATIQSEWLEKERTTKENMEKPGGENLENWLEEGRSMLMIEQDSKKV